MVFTKDIEIRTSEYQQYILITKEIEQAVAESGIREGMVTAISRHTTATSSSATARSTAEALRRSTSWSLTARACAPSRSR